MRKKCKTCNGDGWVINPKYVGDGCLYFFFPPKDYTIKCPDCKGSGERGRHK